ncbi:hypothetical protein FOA43_004050 [Brettanomyces nanus]|uniref:Zn(2)-C6 fungal-type domain-containing protein n=1 Tax=Eeniella nana TaxID=13502 RepID=A0A875S6T5_EENNA|nr:uncharacterized protein FOA43_004050 [Brettanomyces nanus]QPG76658.1 hypothetical protein FOA43_004050 [Brettanomyces nanus]
MSSKSRGEYTSSFTTATQHSQYQSYSPTNSHLSYASSSKSPEKINKTGKRSRKGCLTCRSRKRKCDEVRPICFECNRLGIKCVWMASGAEGKNKSRRNPRALRIDEVYNQEFGVKIVRGKVDYKIEDGHVVKDSLPPQ